jgi:hypothetical protein
VHCLPDVSAKATGQRLIEAHQPRQQPASVWLHAALRGASRQHYYPRCGRVLTIVRIVCHFDPIVGLRIK